MKKLLVSIAVLLSLAGALVYTHSDSYLQDAYDSKLNEACPQSSSPPLCFIGAALIKSEVVTCMKKHFFSTSDKVVAQCIEEAVDDLSQQFRNTH